MKKQKCNKCGNEKYFKVITYGRYSDTHGLRYDKIEVRCSQCGDRNFLKANNDGTVKEV